MVASHMRSLDILRGVAASGVFLGHFVRQYFPDDHDSVAFQLIDRLGVIGVAVFFVLSGFLIHAGGLRELQRGASIDWMAYARRRFYRIYPAYLVAVVVYALLAAHLPSNYTSPGTTLGVISHLLLFSNFVPGEMHSINGVLWTVVIECHFYMLYPVFVWLIARWPIGRVLALTVFLGTLFFAAATVLTQPGEIRTLAQQAAPAVFWKWALGAVIAEMLINHRLPGIIPWLKRAWLLPVVVALIYLGVFLKGGAIELHHHRFVLPFLCAWLVGLFVFSDLSGWRSVWGEWLGEVSYSIYLWHPLAIAVTLALAPGGIALSAILATLLTGLFAAVSYHAIERPFMRMGHKAASKGPTFRKQAKRSRGPGSART